MLSTRGEINSYLEELERANDVCNDSVFYALLSKGIDLLHIKQKEMAQQFGVCRGSIRYWKNKQFLPHLDLRPAILNWLYEKTAEKLYSTTMFKRGNHYQSPAGERILVRDVHLQDMNFCGIVCCITAVNSKYIRLPNINVYEEEEPNWTQISEEEFRGNNDNNT